MRLPRPHIPLGVRLEVAVRQLSALGAGWARGQGETLLAALPKALAALSREHGGAKMELHHRPALLNRHRKTVRGRTVYDPPANDPAHLVWLPEHEHDIETRVRGQGALRSDFGQARYNKRVAKNRAPKKHKHRWPSRPMSGKGRKIRWQNTLARHAGDCGRSGRPAAPASAASTRR